MGTKMGFNEGINMFNNKRINFLSHLAFLILAALSAGQKNLYALDLTIDLPLNMGKAPLLYNNSTSPTSSAAGLSSRGLTAGSNPISMDPAVEPRGDANFPELACIKENVDFWEKVYSDIDVNEGIVHDRTNLGRVYAVVNLPHGERAKSIFLKREKRLIESQLISLAKKLRSQVTLTPSEKTLAKLFPKKNLTYKFLIEATSNIRIQTGLKSQFTAGVRRSMNYMSVIFPIVKNNGLPIDLAYLPHVESSYNSGAGSKVGALGLWQLMPSTMRSLEGRNAVYRRTDPSVSTKAAMKLLKMDYDKTGSWPLALTAYNHGLNGITHAIQETKSRDLCKIIEHYDSPSFKFASSNFYAQFLAARKVAKRKYKILANTQRNSILKQNLLTATGGTFR